MCFFVGGKTKRVKELWKSGEFFGLSSDRLSRAPDINNRRRLVEDEAAWLLPSLQGVDDEEAADLLQSLICFS